MSQSISILTCLSALGQETRLQVFRVLMRAGAPGMPAGAIAETVGAAPNTLSSHLAILHRSGLIEVERHGKSLVYSASIEAVRDMMNALVQDCCDGHPEVCAALSDIDEIAC